MKLQKLYSLRKDFTIIGLTGRVGSGCTEIANKLGKKDFIESVKVPSKFSSKSDELKFNICFNYLNFNDNWEEFKILSYKNVLLFHLIHEANKHENFKLSFIDIIFQNGENGVHKGQFKNRFDKIIDNTLLEQLQHLVQQSTLIFDNEKNVFGCDDLNDCLADERKKAALSDFFFGKEFNTFSEVFFNLLNTYNITKRSRLVHDLANNLRAFGNVYNPENNKTVDLNNIYTIAETINRIIKAWRNKNGTCKVVIDSLKNSLELMFFKEKYSGFYMVASNKADEERKQYVIKQITDRYSGTICDKHSEEILKLDDSEYKSNDYKKGLFSTPDIENCIQKSDYHLYINNDKNFEDYYLDIDTQLIKLIALISQPGIITPTAVERTMQIAYNAKFNSGCISRQVGAAITDENFTVKSIGWNDVPQGQIPCNLRSSDDLISKTRNQDIFTQFEKNGGDYEDKESFYDKFSAEIAKGNTTELNGRNCSFCFKSFHNAFEAEKNQVHTRSLHAEENAMMQITKYGGLGLKGGNLFTTASPCELCSKKAFQLGVKNIYYIDPYPGIATSHILKSGLTNISNPVLVMFQGAVGRAFHKLYEPFMAYKDEIAILTGINPKPSIENQIRTLIKNKDLSNKIISKIDGMSDIDKEKYLEKYLGIMLEKIEEPN